MKLKLPELKTESLTLYCNTSGISANLLIPALPGKALEWQSPFASYTIVRGCIEEGAQYLSKLPAPILAGLTLSGLTHFHLIGHEDKSSSAERNAMLCTVVPHKLINLLLLFPKINTKNAPELPKLSFSLIGQQAATFDTSIYNYTLTLASIFYDSIERGHHVQMYERPEQAQYKKIKASTLSDDERDFEKRLPIIKAELKQLIKEEKDYLTSKVLELLIIISQNRNLVTLSAEVRDKLVKALNESERKGQIRIARLLIEANNPYDIFTQIDDALERASDDFSKKPIRTIAEIIEQKRMQKCTL